MRFYVAFSVLAVLLLSIQTTALATEERDYIDADVQEWTTIADEDGFTTLGTYVDTIDSIGAVYTFDLAPGVYHFYSSGGMHIQDLDVYLYGPDGQVLGSDVLPDKIPIVVLMLRERTEVQINLSAYSFESGYTEDFFCMLVACEAEGEIFSGERITEPVASAEGLDGDM